jgi:hypothetical protein
MMGSFYASVLKKYKNENFLEPLNAQKVQNYFLKVMEELFQSTIFLIFF